MFFEDIFPYASRIEEIRGKRDKSWDTVIEHDELNTSCEVNGGESVVNQGNDQDENA